MNGFSIVIPTWNNLPFLKKCIESIQGCSQYHHQIILHINDGSDGTLEWVLNNYLEHTLSKENIGICRGVNRAAALAKKEYIMYMNDDMVALPQWDLHLSAAIEQMETDKFMLSATMMEPTETGNNAVIVADFGRSPETFDHHGLLEKYVSFHKNDWSGASWPPVLVPTTLWHEVGGLSIEFSPGMYSDPDLAIKLWQVGVREFKGVSKSRIYHFQKASTGRVKKNNGRKQFMRKWGISSSFFYKHYLHMGKDYHGALKKPSKLKRSLNHFTTSFKYG